MWVLSGDGRQLVNLREARRIFLNQMQDCVLIGVDFGDRPTESKIAGIGKYVRPETGEEVLSELGQSIRDDRKLYIMPSNKYDVITSKKIMDSRVKRRGGS